MVAPRYRDRKRVWISRAWGQQHREASQERPRGGELEILKTENREGSKLYSGAQTPIPRGAPRTRVLHMQCGGPTGWAEPWGLTVTSSVMTRRRLQARAASLAPPGPVGRLWSRHGLPGLRLTAALTPTTQKAETMNARLSHGLRGVAWATHSRTAHQ